MTDAETPAPRTGPTRNWGAVLLVVTAITTIALALADGLSFALASDAFPEAPEVLAATTIVVASAGLIVSLSVLAFGSRRLMAVSGRALIGRVLFALWGLILVVFTLTGLLVYATGLTPLSFVGGIHTTLAIAIVVVGIAAAIFVARGGVAHGFARASLFVTVGLFGIGQLVSGSESSGSFAVIDGNFGWSLLWFGLTAFLLSLPGLLGPLILGISYWRTGITVAEPDA